MSEATRAASPTTVCGLFAGIKGQGVLYCATRSVMAESSSCSVAGFQDLPSFPLPYSGCFQQLQTKLLLGINSLWSCVNRPTVQSQISPFLVWSLIRLSRAFLQRPVAFSLIFWNTFQVIPNTCLTNSCYKCLIQATFYTLAFRDLTLFIAYKNVNIQIIQRQ